jgi:hypothetical protein
MQAVPSQPLGGGNLAPTAQHAPSSWPLYLPRVEFDPEDRRAVLVDALLSSLGGDAGWQLLRRVRTYLPQASPESDMVVTLIWVVGAC